MFLRSRLSMLRLLSMALVVMILGAACSPTASTPQASQAGQGASPSASAGTKATGEPIKVGLLLTNVGGTALFAKYEEKGARLLIDQTNKSGGINGRPIELVAYDTEGKPDRAAELFRRLANEDKVVAVIGPDSIIITLGMSNVPSEVKTLSVSGVGNLELVKPADRDWLVTGWASGGFWQMLGMAYVKNQKNVKRIGVVTTADAIGEQCDKLVRGIAKMLDIEVVKTVAQPASDTDLLPSLQQLAAINPPLDAIHVYGSGPFGNIAINQTELVGLNVPITYNGGNIVPELIKDVGPNVSKNFYMATNRLAVLDTLPKDDPFLPELKQFAEDYQKAYGEPPTLPSGTGYDMALAVVDALKAVGPDREKIREYVHTKQELKGRQGVNFKRTATDGVGTPFMDTVIVNIENGKFVFKDYLKPSFDALKISESQVIDLARSLSIVTQ